MSQFYWGLLGPELLTTTRRTRTLGLGAAVRHFNDLAVPGLGGVWYGKQLLLATLGVAVAEEARSSGAKVNNIEVANAIEAVACYLSFKRKRSDARLRGNNKLRGIKDLSFQKVRQKNFYVTQPMRMATAQALPSLGFVESESVRFNAFHCTSEGREILNQAMKDCRPHNRDVITHLVKWVLGKHSDLLSDDLFNALSPLIPLTKMPEYATKLLLERLTHGGNELEQDKQRRVSVLAWVESLRNNSPDKLTWEELPQQFSEDHWHDLQAGALFFEAREAAIATLDAAEAHIGNQGAGQFLSLKHQVPDSLAQPLEKLKSAAEQYLNHVSKSSPDKDRDAKAFCNECIRDEDSVILRNLVNRDGHVLRLIGDEIKPGAAFRGSITEVSANDEDQETPKAGDIALPKGISYRVRNLYLLNLDMHGELDEWLKKSNDEGNL